MLKFHAFLTLCILSLNKASSDPTSFLNSNEIENFKYQIDIDTSVKLASKFNKDEDSNNRNDYISIKSVYGQEYECYLPNNPEYLNSLNDDDSEKTEESNSNAINFTLVNEHIQNYSKKMKNYCVQKVFYFNYIVSFNCKENVFLILELWLVDL
jgi:hypothetical protein